MRVRIAILLALVSFAAHAQQPGPFAYDPKAPLAVRQLSATTEHGVRIEQLTYQGVPATVIAPASPASRGAAIVFMHWGLGDRHTWIDDAKVLAGRGVVSLLIDAPFQRPGAKGTETADIIRSVIDVRRGIDLLQARPDVDKERIGFVGLRFGSHIGSIVSSVEPRVKALVLMGGLASRANEGPEMAELDAEKWIARPRQNAVFLQFATNDEYITREQADKLTNAAGRAALVKWYDGAHELVRESRDNRMQWLAGHLGFSMNDPTYHTISAEPSPGFAGTRYEEMSRQGVVLEVPGMQHVRVVRDIVYKKVGEQALKFDAYYPFGVEHEPELRVPAILLVSGQAAPEAMPKMRGMRFVTTSAQAIAARANRVVIVYDLRSILDPGHVDVAKDLDDLIRYLREHGAKHQIDGESLGILARSAGGTYGIRGAWLGERPWIKAVSLQYTDVAGAELRDSNLAPSFLAEISPLELLKQPGKRAPLLLVTMQHDFFYDAKAVAALKEAAAKNGTTVEHIHLPNSDHGYEVVNDTEESRAAFLRTILFFRERMPIRR